MNVAEWLRSLGLNQYEAAFRENDIDSDVLPELTAEDLNALGITSVGHRRRILSAAASLKAGVRRARENDAEERSRPRSGAPANALASHHP